MSATHGRVSATATSAHSIRSARYSAYVIIAEIMGDNRRDIMCEQHLLALDDLEVELALQPLVGEVDE